MNHKIKGRKLGRTTAHLEAMLANQARRCCVMGGLKPLIPNAKN
jgi:ribosomal protein L17